MISGTCPVCGAHLVKWWEPDVDGDVEPRAKCISNVCDYAY